MTRSTLLKSALCALMLPLLSCNLIDVTGDEDARSGRGARVHDPYQSLASGALKLSLQYFNGCAMLPNGQMIAKNSTVGVTYPDVCATPLQPLNPISTLTPPTGQLKLLTNTPYFLNQLSVTDSALNMHTNPTDLTAALRWIRTQSWMRHLDWGNVGAAPEDWSFVAGFIGVTQDSWTREVRFHNANWEKVEGDTITVQVLDRDGNERSSVEYLRSELLASTPFAGHSRASWRMEAVQAPRFPGDNEPRPVATRVGQLPQAVTYRTIARVDLVGSTNPFKTFTTPPQAGEGVLKVTWSQMPDNPFYFPVTFVAPEDVPATCTDDEGQPKQCGFGLDPRLTLVEPTDGGSYYQPGETLKINLDYRDGDGNRLHGPSALPSAAQVATDQSNGLLSFVPNMLLTTVEADNTLVVGVAGPLEKMRVQHNPFETPGYFRRVVNPIENAALLRLVPSMYTSPWPTQLSFTLPTDAEPGTYVAIIKGNRFFLGERISKMKPFYFQVGEDEESEFPARVGNCQICHRGVLSLDNLRHGVAVDHVELCKTCHQGDNDQSWRFPELMHRIHMNSPRYTAAKTDCTICHLTLDSAIRPSLTVCGSCHPTQHGDKYFQTTFTNAGEPNRFGNCAQTCHGEQPPKSHILPSN